MLQVHSLSKSYGITTVLSDVSFVLNDGEHVGLIGPNGAGKSTLLRCITAQLAPDAGTITRTPPDLVLGYLPQGWDASDQRTTGMLVAAAQAAFVQAEEALQHAANALAEAADPDQALVAYEQALAQFETLSGYEREHRAAAVLDHLGLSNIDSELPIALLSGGQKTRLGLATLLLQEPDMLLLDEPTNHLDTDALDWLEAWVRQYHGAVLIVSHDRTFLDRTVERVLFLDSATHTLTSYAGNYSAFAGARAAEREQQWVDWQDQQEHIAQVDADIQRIKGQAQTIQSGPKRGRDFYGKVSAKVARQAKVRERKLQRYLESDEHVAKPRQQWNLKLDFGPAPPSGRAVLRVEDIGFAYPNSPALFEHASFDVGYGERIAIMGPNGAGKSTLLRLIAGELEPTAGVLRLSSGVRVGVLAQEHEQLDLQQTVLNAVLQTRMMSQTGARNFLHFFLFGGDSVFRLIGACSLGERSRLQLALLVLQGCNLLLLDEPLNHLDIEGREQFEQALDAFEGTIMAVTHDRAFVHGFAERVLLVHDTQVRESD